MLQPSTDIQSCIVGPTISTDQFITEHFFLYLISGTIVAFDGNKRLQIQSGDFGLVRRNTLVKYFKQRDSNDEFKKVVMIFDQQFLKDFFRDRPVGTRPPQSSDAIVQLEGRKKVEAFLKMLNQKVFSEEALSQKWQLESRMTLLNILLAANPELGTILSQFDHPGKIELEAFMNRNYKFNIGLDRFAYLTGRSMSAFKRDFYSIFNDTPSRWLTRKRLQEAYFLLRNKNKTATDIYYELGFENLSHFSFAFKKQFGFPPTAIKQLKT